MKVLFLTAELAPLAKVGGLADVSAELPAALRRRGVDVRVCVPLHASLDASALELKYLGEVRVGCPEPEARAQISSSTSDGVPIYWIDGEPVRRVAGIYGPPGMEGPKYTFSALAGLHLDEVTGWVPDILHANDWHAAPAVLGLARRRAPGDAWFGVRSLLTVHNLAYMGAGAEQALTACGFVPSQAPGLPEWARHLPLPMGLASADWISTVSPTYAGEIQGKALGNGLEGLLAARRARLWGILNGTRSAAVGSNHQFGPLADL